MGPKGATLILSGHAIWAMSIRRTIIRAIIVSLQMEDIGNAQNHGGWNWNEFDLPIYGIGDWTRISPPRRL
jgi:hypothetical protein